jgi:hypothetical protein
VTDPGRFPLALAVDAVVSRGILDAHKERVAAMHRRFEERTGAFSAEAPWFEARSRAFWDDAITRQGFARHVFAELPEEARDWVPSLERAHRGLFYASRIADRHLLRDLWSGAEFMVDDVDDASRSALDAPSGPFDGRLAALSNPVRVGLLPGAVFHPEDATDPIERVLDAAREQRIPTDEVLDALLRMEMSLRTLSRVKPGYAYRIQALPR